MRIGTAPEVRQVEVPSEVHALCTLPRIDYEDAFVAETPMADTRTAEEWARAILEDAPIKTRSTLVSGWTSLGLQLGSLRSDRFVLGWKVLQSTPDFLLLGAGSRVGMPAELVLRRDGQGVLVATLIQQDNPAVRAAWAGVGPVHRQVVPRILERAIRL